MSGLCQLTTFTFANSSVKLLKHADVFLTPLEGKTVAVLGYGNQGRAQALNLADDRVTQMVQESGASEAGT